MGQIPQELKDIIQKEADAAGYKVVDVTTRGGRGLFIEISLDKDGGISLDECGAFNRKISAWMDAAESYGEGNTIDVCSPGLDRALKSDSEFEWAVGKDVRVNTYEPVGDDKIIEGRLAHVDGSDTITIEKEGTPVVIERRNISKAKIKAAL